MLGSRATAQQSAGVSPRGFGFPVRTRLLGNDILVIENLGLGLEEVLGKRVAVAAAPFRIREGDASSIAPLAMTD